MIWLAEIGHLFLILSLSWPICTGFLNIFPVRKWSQMQFLWLSASLLTLTICFLRNDFSVQYVYHNSYSLLPWYYRICAVWGAHEGSWLLWSWLMSLWALLVTHIIPKNLSLLPQFKQNMAVIYIGFISFMLFTSNPFIRLLPNIPNEGQGLNPLLQDPGMIIHPPILYSGYVGLIVLFSIALAALRQNKYEMNWQKYAIIIAEIAWVLLTAGIALGSWWAYRELGWGGFWGWDPVENASLLPWLVATGLIHLLRLQLKQKYHQQLILLFTALAFFLSILGSFLLRSGLVISVHAFASDPGRGMVLLILLAIIIISCIFHAYRRFHQLEQLPNCNSTNKQKLIQAQALLFAASAITVLLGTIYPLISQVMWHENLSVGAPYFNKMLLPNLLLILCLMAFLLRDIFKHKIFAIVLAIAAIICSISIFKTLNAAAISFAIIIFTLVLSIYVILKPNQEKRLFLISHIGFMIMLIGIIISTNFDSAKTELLNVGDSIHITDHKVAVLNSVVKTNGPNYHGYIANFQVDNKNIQAEERIYNASSILLPKVGIITSLLGSDTYIAISASKQGWLVRTYFKPLIRWIWIGAILMVLGAVFLLFKRRKSCA